MTPRTIANRLLEAEPDDLDPGAEIERLTTSQFPGIEIEVEGNHWNVYKQWQGSQHFIGEIYYVDMADAPVEIMTPEARAFHETHRWVSIAGFRTTEMKECKTFEQAIHWIIAVNAAKTAPVREALDPDDPEANIERFARDRSVPAQMEITVRRFGSSRRWRVQIVWDYDEGGTAFDDQGRPLPKSRPEPTVEFYDMTYDNMPSFKGGQLVSRYHASTLVEHEPGVGLDLHGGEPVWKIDGDSMDQIVAWVRREVEGRGYKLNKEGGQHLWTYEGIDDPDDPEPYLHPEKFTGQPPAEKVEGALRRMLAPYYTSVRISKRPGLLHRIGKNNPFQDNFIWTIHCNRDTPLPLSHANRHWQGYNLDWRNEAKLWFEKWAAHAGLALVKFEIYGRLRKDPTFQLETARVGPLRENDEDLSPEAFFANFVDKHNIGEELPVALSKWHPYGTDYNAMVGPRFALITVRTYFPPEKDNFYKRFEAFVVDWLTNVRKVMTVNSTKLTGGKDANSEPYPRWTLFLAINMDWPPDTEPYVPPTVEPGPGAPVEVGQP